MRISENLRRYWRRNLWVTSILMLIWFVVTFVMGFFAIPLATIHFFGWPLSFYMAAQGSLVIYVLIIWYYARRMGKLDRDYDVAEGD